ncbi:HIT domain-containing protein [Eikenella sp. NML96-A-049]|uniref:HIT family protein n=1 Tax=unclassified Eikenella TaxID=2639367 RepID=UPI0007E25C08|nr:MULTISPECIES: HIT family protein [unclassified Eikenella]OAM33090.1 HIT domain-containing protein [Eikenella sp. NML070372]OAM42289.1 HIT domain-containing protein [Eikenella sp. NML96-A-049]VDG99319.1 HIT domain [Helicobacter pametensis]
MPASCPLCRAENETVLWQNSCLRVIAVNDTPAAPAFCCVIWCDHVAEMTDLPATARQEMMAAVWRTEAAMRRVLRPAKINLASFGNQVPHLHWHVIARFENDAFFPDSIWAAPRREAVPTLPANWQRQVAELLAKEEETDGLV